MRRLKGLAGVLMALAACRSASNVDNESVAGNGGQFAQGGALEPPLNGGAAAQLGGFGGGLGGSSAGGSAGVNLLEAIARTLDGFSFALPCVESRGARACSTLDTRPCPADRDPALTGARPTDETLFLPGDPQVIYEIALRVQGIVEARNYQGGMDQDSTERLPADGFYVGGHPAVGSAYGVYMIRVSDPKQDYFLNAIATPTDNRLRHSVFPVDYEARIHIRGAAALRLVAADPNCYSLRNCADPDVPGTCTPHSLDRVLPTLEPELAASTNQFLRLRVMSVSATRAAHEL